MRNHVIVSFIYDWVLHKSRKEIENPEEWSILHFTHPCQFGKDATGEQVFILDKMSSSTGSCFLSLYEQELFLSFGTGRKASETWYTGGYSDVSSSRFFG